MPLALPGEQTGLLGPVFEPGPWDGEGAGDLAGGSEQPSPPERIFLLWEYPEGPQSAPGDGGSAARGSLRAGPSGAETTALALQIGHLYFSFL